MSYVTDRVLLILPESSFRYGFLTTRTTSCRANRVAGLFYFLSGEVNKPTSRECQRRNAQRDLY